MQPLTIMAQWTHDEYIKRTKSDCDAAYV